MIFFLCDFSGKRDEVVIKVQRQRSNAGHWWFSQQALQDEVMLTLHSPPAAIVGQYRLAVLVMSPNGHIVRKIEGISFHLLFNPWNQGDGSWPFPITWIKVQHLNEMSFPLEGIMLCHVTWRVCVCVLADDAVYLPDETQLQEYLMNEDGIIYSGTAEYISSISWNYGQVSQPCLYVHVCVLVRLASRLCEFSQQCDNRQGNVFVGWRRIFEETCENVGQPLKQGLVLSRLAVRTDGEQQDRQTGLLSYPANTITSVWKYFLVSAN